LAEKPAVGAKEMIFFEDLSRLTDRRLCEVTAAPDGGPDEESRWHMNHAGTSEPLVQLSHFSEKASALLERVWLVAGAAAGHLAAWAR
jgi:hypothetical protein